jgi:beta-phosphoglucomutase-like phosphatase (HAD superfamily)
MKIKGILFDLDGVLVDSDGFHFRALNLALEMHGLPVISAGTHAKELKGRPTSKKLEILTSAGRFPYSLLQQVSKSKQLITKQLMSTLVTAQPQKSSLLKALRSYGIKVAVCSNS